MAKCISTSTYSLPLTENDLAQMPLTENDLAQMLTLLSPVKHRWFILGIHLGIKKNKLEEIQKSYSTASFDEQMLQMLDCWLKSDPSCSWSTVINALGRMDNTTALVAELHSKLSDECTIHPPEQLEPGFDLNMYDELKASYVHLLTIFRQQLIKGKLHLDDVKYFLSVIMDDVKFRKCKTPDKVIDRLRSQMHVYNISPMQQTVEKFCDDRDDELYRIVELYESKRIRFLSGTHIVKLSTSQMSCLPEDMCEVKFLFNKAVAHEKTIKEIDMLSRKLFGPCYHQLSEMTRSPSTHMHYECVTWKMPKIHALDIIAQAREQLSYLKEHGVEDVKVGNITMSSCFQMQQYGSVNSRRSRDTITPDNDTRIGRAQPAACQQKCRQLTKEKEELEEKLKELQEIVKSNKDCTCIPDIEKLLKMKTEGLIDGLENTCLMIAIKNNNKALIELLLSSNIVGKSPEMQLAITLQENEMLREELKSANAEKEQLKQKLQSLQHLLEDDTLDTHYH